MKLLTVKTIAGGEFKTLVRQKTFVLLLTIFLFMAAFSAFIGWSTKNTVTKIYVATVRELISSGTKKMPVNPFLSAPPLSILKNMPTYVFLIGSLLAIIIGYSSFVRERKAGVIKIIFSRQISRVEFLLGKITGIFLVLSAIVGLSFVLSFFSVVIISGQMLVFSEMFKLLMFYLVSFLYLIIFAMLGLFFAIFAKSESLALLAPMIIWIFISFVMPQLTSALDPNSLLNPTSIQSIMPQSVFFTSTRFLLEPFSVSENYKTISQSFLQGDIKEYPIFSLIVYLFFTMSIPFLVIKKFNVCEVEIE